ncbi:sporulation protein Cse60 [Treponema vincentii]|uniref:Sporulation protein Cse60 n=1 Tax=Treponema vincentii TaxID=69710 RepID=A0A6P1Y0R3_9SPIR|nr:sporulation protein Cse60 [Treponema vincentii]QHX42840.1 sporulation protein Cse60 [Treponema vincentii]
MTYVKKVKIFCANDEERLENKLNDFLSKEIEKGFHIISIQYQLTSAYDASSIIHDIVETFSCMVYYSEPVEE